MFWEKVKFYLKATWLFIQKYWSLFLLLILTVLSIVLMAGKQNQVQNLLKMLQAQADQHGKDLTDLQRIRDEELKKREDLQKQYDAVIARINQEHASAVANLNRQKQEEIKKLIEQFQDDPNRMADEVNNLLGLPIQKVSQ